MNQRKDNFFDPKTLMAIVLVGVSWMGWQWYLQKKYPDAYKPKKAESQMAVQSPGANSDNNKLEAKPASTLAAATKEEETVTDPQKPEQLTAVDADNMSFNISSRGMGVRDLQLKQYKNREGEPVHFGPLSGFLPFETNLLNRRTPLFFNVEKVEDSLYIGRAKSAGLQIIKTMRIDAARYSIETTVEVRGDEDEFQGITTYLADQIHRNQSSNFLLPQFDHQEFFATSAGSHERWMIIQDEDMTHSLAKVNVAALGSQYFSQAIVDRSSILPELKVAVSKGNDTALGSLNYSATGRTDIFKIEYTTFMGPKSYNLLTGINEELGGVINYGMFSFIAHYILALLKWFFTMTGNWGVAIILLTILVRIFVLPFAIMSYKSMKAMQQIQPQIKTLREKHKDDQQKLNLEMMALLKTHKVNPLGGCLPMFLQFPIFLALYQVLGQSIELYQAPFILWIHDLSLKDPYYVLPVLMGLTLFIQQKITPSTLDPMQAKVLMFMPLLFTFFMLSLPSGLTLYIFISGVFGILQQIYFMRDKQSAT